MKVLGICCSPRLHGNTEIMLQAALDKAKEEGAETELVTLSKKKISPCDGCLSCRQTKVCYIKDDMQALYPKLLEADGLLFGTPVYFGTVSAQAKIFIDRTYALLEERSLRNKVAGLVVTTRRVGSTSAFAAFSFFFNSQRMIIVGSAMGFGGNDREAVRNDKQGMAGAEALGRATVRRILAYRIQD